MSPSALAARAREKLNGAKAPALVDAPDVLPSAVRAIDVSPENPVEFRAGIMTAGDLGLLVGEDGSMKSTLALHLAGATSGGYRFLGRFETLAAPSLIISEEDTAGVIRNRLEAMCRGHGWNPEIVLANVHIIAKAEVELTSSTWKRHLNSEIERIRPAIIVADPLAELITGEENSNTDARPIIKTLRSLARPTAANVIAVHHFGKPSEGKRMGDLIRGASAWRRASRFTYAVEHDDERHELRVSCLKLSRAGRLAPFVVRYFIDADSESRTVWRSARFEYVSETTAALDHAETFVRDQLSLGERLNTTQLKDAAKGTGVSGADISRAIKGLEMRRLIDFADGPKGSKMWGLLCLPSNSRQPGQPELLLAGQPDSLPGNHSRASSACLAPIGASRNAAAAEAGNQTDESYFGEGLEPDESQLAMLEADG